VIIPTQNRPQMLREAVASVLSQTYRDFELILVLNAATSETLSVAQAIVASDTRARIIVLQRSGSGRARNAGIKEARGAWIAFLDDDDCWLPEKLEFQSQQAAASGADLVACEMMRFDGTPIHAVIPAGLTIKEALMLSCCLPGSVSGAFVRTQALRALGGFDESMRIAQDWDMWRRFSWHYNILLTGRVLVRYRIHDGNITRLSELGLTRGILQNLIKLTLHCPPDLRHMIGRAWRQECWREAAGIYLAANRASGGRLQLIWRFLRDRVFCPKG
jgi:glycosyltransferase involved in cell wall biosynthesis